MRLFSALSSRKSGGSNQTDHLGSYSYLWWVNGLEHSGKRNWPDVPEDAFAALGHGGERGLLAIPSLDLVLSWNDAKIADRAAQNRCFGMAVRAVGAAKRVTVVGCPFSLED